MISFKKRGLTKNDQERKKSQDRDLRDNPANPGSDLFSSYLSCLSLFNQQVFHGQVIWHVPQSVAHVQVTQVPQSVLQVPQSVLQVSV
jgi:hypothetical protein